MSEENPLIWVNMYVCVEYKRDDRYEKRKLLGSRMYRARLMVVN